MRVVGSYFLGVVSSNGLAPDGGQDVARVNSERARIAVADGAGDTGAAAGDWAGILALCYATSRENIPAKAPEWLARAVETWSVASNAFGSAMGDASLNVQELSLLQRGVECSFAGAAFAEGEQGVSIRWVAAGDCELLLFRRSKLVEWAPIRSPEDFSGVAGGLNSLRPDARRLRSGEWNLEEGDVLFLATDALAQFILRESQNEALTSDRIQTLSECREWADLREYVAMWRRAADGRLKNDDTALVRVSLRHEATGDGFALVRDRVPTASPVFMALPSSLPTFRPPAVEQPAVPLRPRPREPVTHPPLESKARAPQAPLIALISLLVLATVLQVVYRNDRADPAGRRPPRGSPALLGESEPRTNESRVADLRASGAKDSTGYDVATHSSEAQNERDVAVQSSPKEKPVRCEIPRGTRVFSTSEGEAWAMFMPSQTLKCKESGRDSRQITFEVWIPLTSGEAEQSEMAWLESGKLAKPMNAWASPSEHSRYLGNVRGDTPFVLKAATIEEGKRWVCLELTGYRELN